MTFQRMLFYNCDECLHIPSTEVPKYLGIFRIQVVYRLLHLILSTMLLLVYSLPVP